jgi:hypothetical protein
MILKFCAVLLFQYFDMDILNLFQYFDMDILNQEFSCQREIYLLPKSYGILNTDYLRIKMRYLWIEYVILKYFGQQGLREENFISRYLCITYYLFITYVPGY